METSPLAVGTSASDIDTWLDRVVEVAAERTDAFEARAELSGSLTASWEDGSFRNFSQSRLAGVCVRVWADGAAGFASSHDPSREAVRAMVDQALRAARANAREGSSGFPYNPQGAETVTYRPDVDADPFEEEPQQIAELLERVEDGIREVDPGAYARPRLGASSRRIRFEDADGRCVSKRFLLTTLQAGALHRDGDRPGECILSSSGERGLTDFEDEGGPETLGQRAATRAEEAARAKPAPAGRHRVLCDPVLSGLLAHESFGHLTEYDLVASGWSRLAGRRGERFADETVSIVDAPVSPGDPKDGIALPYDEEGTRGQPVRVLDEGVLENWMHKRASAPETDQEPTGNARAFNVRYRPLVRMRNTYIEPGEHSFEELLEELDDGVYLLGARGGAPASDGSFTFTSDHGYLVEDGELQHPIRPTTISGNIFEFLDGVEGLGRDFDMHATVFGGCGKWGQSFLPVGTGGPHTLVDEALVGGRE